MTFEEFEKEFRTDYAFESVEPHEWMRERAWDAACKMKQVEVDELKEALKKEIQLEWLLWWEKNDPGIIPGEIDSLERDYIKRYCRLAFDNFTSRIMQQDSEIDELKEEITRLNNSCVAFAETLDITMILKNGLKEEIEAKDNRINELIEEIKRLKPYETLHLQRRPGDFL